MKIPFILGLMFALQLEAGAEDTILANNIQKAAEALPRGGIVVAEKTRDRVAIFSTAGTLEPAGVPPENVIFEIGSISKIFTAILLAQAVLEKRVQLETTLQELLGKQLVFADPNVAAITLEQLATHTSGLPRIPDNTPEGTDPADPYARYDRTHLDAYLASAKLAHGAPFPSNYSNLGVGLLGDLLVRIYGQSWEELVAERVTKPLGLIDTAVTLNPEQAKRAAPGYAGEKPARAWHFLSLAGAGALHSTAADLLKLGEALRDPGSTPLRDAIAMIEQPRHGLDVGLCLQILSLKNQQVFWFAGGTGGFRSWISVTPSTQRVVALLTNNDALPAEQVLSGQVNPAKPAGPPDPALAVYAGQYDTGLKAGGAAIYYSFEARGSELWMQVSGQPFVPLRRHATAADRFEFQPVQAEIQFVRENGQIAGTKLFQEGLEIYARKLSGHEKTP